MKKREYTCCFTGHRELPISEIPAIKTRLRAVVMELIERGVCFFGAGGALGFDTLVAQIVLELRQEFRHIKLILVLPCADQARGWRKEEIEIYEKIKAQADKVVCLAEHYFRGCMHRRNRHLVDYSAYCVCYLTEKSGGTAYTVRYAQERGLAIINIAA